MGGLSGSGYTLITGAFGGPGYIPVSADYDRDGKADPTVFHQDTGIWELFLSTRVYQELSGGFGGPEYASVGE